MKKIPAILIVTIGALVFVGACMAYVFTFKAVHVPVSSPVQSTDTPTSVVPAPIQYSCKDGKTFNVLFGNLSARVSLEKNQTIILSQVSTDDENGTQFKNSDGKLVLWVRDQSSFIEQNGTTTYAGCRAS